MARDGGSTGGWGKNSGRKTGKAKTRRERYAAARRNSRARTVGRGRLYSDELPF